MCHTGGNHLTPTVVVLNYAVVVGCLVTDSGWHLFSSTKMNVSLIHVKKQWIFCLYFHTNLSRIEGPSKAAALCLRAENVCGECLLGGKEDLSS